MVEKSDIKYQLIKEKISLNQLGNTAELFYQIVNKDTKNYEEHSMTCKDYLTDLLFSKHYNHNFVVHGLNTNESNYSLHDDNIAMVLYNTDKFIKNEDMIVSFINNLETKINIKHSTFKLTADKQLECSFNKFWFTEPYLISLLMNLIRTRIIIKEKAKDKDSRKLEELFHEHKYEELLEESYFQFEYLLSCKLKPSIVYTLVCVLESQRIIYANTNKLYLSTEVLKKSEIDKPKIYEPLQKLLNKEIINQKKLYEKSKYININALMSSVIHDIYGISNFTLYLERDYVEDTKLKKFICQIETEPQDTIMKEKSEKKLKITQD